MSNGHTTHRADARNLLDDRGYRGKLIRGQNPVLLFEKAVRDRITESLYWKEQCFGLNAATLCDRAVELKYIGGTYGDNGKPTPFLCLAFKMVILVLEDDVVLAMLNWSKPTEQEQKIKEKFGTANGNYDDDYKAEIGEKGVHKKSEFKYLRALAAFYIRLCWEPKAIYETLEPLLQDYRKLRRRTREGFTLTHVDEVIDDLLSKDRMFATSLWKLGPRSLLEDLEILEPRVSVLQNEIDAMEEEEERLKEESRERSKTGYNSVESDGEIQSERERSDDS